MLQQGEAIVATPLTAARNLICEITAPFNGTLEGVYLHSDSASSGGDSTFDINLDGATIFGSPTDRPKILSGTQNGSVINLAHAVTRNQKITVDADVVAAGGVGGKLYIVFEFDDGVPAPIIWRNAWAIGTAYVLNDAVSYNGSSWRAKRANTGVAPVEGADWTILAAKGAQGDVGPQGDVGAAGAPATITRGDVVKTTAALADNAEETGTVALGKSFFLLRVAADRAARVRLYSTAAARAADASRAIGTDPSGEHGLISDHVLIPTNLSFDCSPQLFGANLEAVVSGDIAYAIQNRSGGSHTVEVTFTRITLET